MFRIFISFYFGFLFIINTFAQQPTTPLELNNYKKTTSYKQLGKFVHQQDLISGLISVETIGQSVKNRNIYALKFSKGEFGKDKTKIKVIFFAQQHGNEQSGKEGALLLAETLLKPENKYLLEKIDFALIPQMNPDGSEINQRRNANDKDLNRNHLIMTEPEVIALHKFFDKYQFEVNMDIHEYFPYTEEWEKYGYRKNADITIGANTNPNISEKIREFSNTKIVPSHLQNLKNKGFTSFIYCPGGPPEIEYIRHSTFDVNDGRQSFGILNSFSFIQEGRNGTDSYVENIKHRAEGQMTGMLTMLDFIYNHKDEMKNMVFEEREKLISGNSNRMVSIQSEHVQNGLKLNIPLFSYFSSTDSVVIVNDYRPVVKSIFDVKKPLGYLIPKTDLKLIIWAANHSITYSDFKKEKNQKIEQYLINSIDSLDFEGDKVVNLNFDVNELQEDFNNSNYIYIPVNQLKGNMIVLALEPKSMLGLITYKQYEYLLKSGSVFPILRVIEK